MGATEVVQGVSASSIGLILGVYQELVQSISAINAASFKLLRDKKFEAFWAKINGNFLLSVLSGIVISLFFLTTAIALLLQRYFIPVTAFLFAIIAISGVLLLRKVTDWRPRIFFYIAIGISISYFFSIVPSLNTSNNYLFVLLSGFLSGFTFLIPGISSAFILLLIGKYQLIVISFSTLNLAVIVFFVLGALAGLWLASRFIARIFADHYSTTIALLAGLMLGALNKLWPWRQVFEYVTNRKGDQIPAYDVSILPWNYIAVTGKNPQVFQAILMMALGVFLVVLIEKIAAGLKTKM